MFLLPVMFGLTFVYIVLVVLPYMYITISIRQKKNICVFQVSRPYLSRAANNKGADQTADAQADLHLCCSHLA